jgi:hypothetical protein
LRCPEDQHPFPIFADTTKGTVVYMGAVETFPARITFASILTVREVWMIRTDPSRVDRAA